MLELFLYNWQIREDWFSWSGRISADELTKTRIGGMRSILHNLYHVIDCEQIWINQMEGAPVIVRDIAEITSLSQVEAYSQETKAVTRRFLSSESSSSRFLEITRKSGETIRLTHQKILQHIAAHEIHHIGQLSVWAREMGIKPVSSDLVFANSPRIEPADWRRR
ncbi:DinB family protein [Peribacillus sp. SCS-37]|uniref:DinB family protein n=1 Tax=Paraperibacillus esterisolvens TaxID=3115296 RepID=UPI003906A08D